jgi:hypothetical protein
MNTKQTTQLQPLFRTLSKPGEWVRQLPDVWRYLVRGNSAEVILVLGWDRMLATYFAQVWVVPSSVIDYEDGELVYWTDTQRREVPNVYRLASAVKPFVAVPSDLWWKLEAGRRVMPPLDR